MLGWLKKAFTRPPPPTGATREGLLKAVIQSLTDRPQDWRAEVDWHGFVYLAHRSGRVKVHADGWCDVLGKEDAIRSLFQTNPDIVAMRKAADEDAARERATVIKALTEG